MLEYHSFPCAVVFELCHPLVCPFQLLQSNKLKEALSGESSGVRSLKSLLIFKSKFIYHMLFHIFFILRESFLEKNLLVCKCANKM